MHTRRSNEILKSRGYGDEKDSRKPRNFEFLFIPLKEANRIMVVLTEIALPLVALDSITVASILLAIVGTLYLAYDLLGRQHGPLQWLTLIITCGLVSALVLGFVGTIVYLLFMHAFN